MAFRFIENRQSRQSTDKPPTERRSYYASGDTSEAAVRAHAETNTPLTVTVGSNVINRQHIEVIPRGYAQYQVDVPYARDDREQDNWTFDFDTGGGQAHITVPQIPGGGRREKFPPGAGTPDAGAIGEREPDQIDGVNIVIPVLTINVHYQHPDGDITIAEVKRLARLTAKINDAAFLTFAAGEVLFLGARGSDGTTAEVRVTYAFACIENLAGIEIGPVPAIDKVGHDYLWVKFKRDVNANKAVWTPAFVYVDQVYQETDLATELGFGGP